MSATAVSTTLVREESKVQCLVYYINQAFQRVDAKELIRRGDKCQKYENVQQVPREKMTTITSPRSFAHQRIDIVGPLPHGKKQVKLLLIVIDYFTK